MTAINPLEPFTAAPGIPDMSADNATWSTATFTANAN